MPSVLDLPQPTRAATYSLEAAKEIQAFLERYPWIPSLVAAAEAPLAAAFPPPVELVYTIARDPEIPEEEALVVAVQTALPPAEARACLTAFDEAWLLEHDGDFDGKVLFTLRFV